MVHWGKTQHHYMAKANCRIIMQYANWLIDHTQPGDSFADWMEYKISVVRTNISDAYHAWEGMADIYRARHYATNPRHELSYMVRRNLGDIAEYAAKLHPMILDGESLPDWMEHKISVARTYIGSVKHSVESQLRETEHHHHNGYNTNPGNMCSRCNGDAGHELMEGHRPVWHPCYHCAQSGICDCPECS